MKKYSDPRAELVKIDTNDIMTLSQIFEGDPFNDVSNKGWWGTQDPMQ